MKDRKYYAVQPEKFPLLLGSSIYKPMVLYAQGTLPEPTAPAESNASTGNAALPKAPIGIAMVGTRRPSNSAAELCRKLVNSLRGTNAVIVSGLAQGIDSLCHEAALEAGLPTIGVLAQGLDTHIEGSRGDLANRILESGGALVSTFEPDDPAYKGNFIARNKIISGLCAATLVVQSKIKGGALITADFCTKEGKPLLAVPGNFDSEVASGTNQLLDAGRAKPVFKPESLCQVLGLPKKGGLSFGELSAAGCNLSKEATLVFGRVNGYKKTFVELQSEFDFNTTQLLAILTELEIAGLARTEDNFQFYFNGAV
ncbi:DNA-processing protein DprA [Fibrobacter sp.]|uniref:DNA-processing protein DprA n=1 Tax=Fibrobacter sp. TaxID=35828 RepID=UPI0038906A78